MVSYRHNILHCSKTVNRSRISSDGRAPDCIAGGRGFDVGTEPTLGVLKKLRNEVTAFALQAATPSCGSDDHVK